MIEGARWQGSRADRKAIKREWSRWNPCLLKAGRVQKLTRALLVEPADARNGKDNEVGSSLEHVFHLIRCDACCRPLLLGLFLDQQVFAAPDLFGLMQKHCGGELTATVIIPRMQWQPGKHLLRGSSCNSEAVATGESIGDRRRQIGTSTLQ